MHILGPGEDDAKQWVFDKYTPNKFEVKQLLAACLEQGIIALFSNNIYTFGGKFYRQASGGPIGYRVTGATAQIRVADWMAKMAQILSDNHLKIWMEGSYVDDVRLVVSHFPQGWRWSR